MSSSPTIERLRVALGDGISRIEERSSRRVFVDVHANEVREVCHALLSQLGARLQTVTGVDGPPDAIELLYHWALDDVGCVITVRATLDRSQPEIDTIADICPAAEWIEREIRELLGVEFSNHPDPRHLLLRDDWPAGVYPLRRDYRRLHGR